MKLSKSEKEKIVKWAIRLRSEMEEREMNNHFPRALIYRLVDAEIEKMFSKEQKRITKLEEHLEKRVKHLTKAIEELNKGK